MCARLDHFDAIGKGNVDEARTGHPSHGKMRSRSTANDPGLVASVSPGCPFRHPFRTFQRRYR